MSLYAELSEEAKRPRPMPVGTLSKNKGPGGLIIPRSQSARKGQIAVSAYHMTIFEVIFGRRKAQIRWKQFQEAMEGAGYRSKQLYGSVWVFQNVQGDVIDCNFHAPHGSQMVKIEPPVMKGMRTHLKKRYNWDMETFVLRD